MVLKITALKIKKINTLTVCRTLSKICFSLLVLSLSAQLYLSNRTVAESSKMLDLEKKKTTLEKEILFLKTESFSLSSLSRIESEAKKLGFVPFEGPLFAIGPATVAALSE